MSELTVAQHTVLELERLDRLFRPHYQRAKVGDVRATLMCLSIIDHRAQLLGLYPSRRTSLTVSHGGGVLVDPEMLPTMASADVIVTDGTASANPPR
jgi:hypothetical protein